jgi:hypothetical protein
LARANPRSIDWPYASAAASISAKRAFSSFIVLYGGWGVWGSCPLMKSL